MEFANVAVAFGVSQIEDRDDQQIQELNDLQLAVVGGGIAELVGC